MTDLLTCFARTYIVHLPERQDRRREMDAELARFGLCADGERIRYWDATRPRDAGLFPSRGAHGCFLSHLAILEEAQRDQLDSVLILEDDLTLNAALAAAPAAMRERVAAGGWHFAYLGHTAEVADGAPPHWLESKLPLATTHFYALHGSIISRLREHLQACLARPPGHPLGSPMHVDGAYSLFRQFNMDVVTLLAAPSLGGQRSSRSDIHPNRWFDRLPVLRALASLARHAKNRRHRVTL